MEKTEDPSKAAAGVVLFLGFAGGLLFWGAFNTGMEATNTEEFCSGCHAPIVAEIQETIHYSNRSGVRAICSDCHVPHEWTDKIVRKYKHPKSYSLTMFCVLSIHQRSSKSVEDTLLSESGGANEKE